MRRAWTASIARLVGCGLVTFGGMAAGGVFDRCAAAEPTPSTAIAAARESLATGSAGDGAVLAPRPAPIDLNRATLDEIRALPIPSAVAEALVDHRTYVARFTSLFDLLQVPGMTPELLQRIRPRVAVAPIFEAAGREQEDEDRRAGELNMLVQRLLSEEGASEGLVDDYVDQIREPRDINRLGFFDLVGYQNVSPIDAVAVLRERSLAGRIETSRQLRAAQGLSYWGFRNLRDFVTYGESRSARTLHADAQFRLYDTPYVLDDADILRENVVEASPIRNFELNTYGGRLGLDGAPPHLSTKLRLRSGHWKGGILTHRNLGERRWNETVKGFVSVEDLAGPKTPLGALRLRRLVLGHYTVSLGQGLAVDATDFFLARRTGMGYAVRPTGVRGDLSRSDEFALRGAALEASLGRVAATLFVSRDRKDAILNPADSSFHSYFRMVPRLSNDLLAEIRRDIASGVLSGGDPRAYLPMRDVLDERLKGAHLRTEIVSGTSLGLSGLEIRSRNLVSDTPAAQRWNPRDTTLVSRLDKLDPRDAEIGAGYNSIALGDYRRIWGADAQTVWRNLSVAGEYAKLETSRAHGALDRMLSGGPEARVAQAYVQYENWNALALYRNYDLGYDNPYNRAFSEDSKFEQTLIDGNAFYLNNPYWAELARNLPQPKAERGLYLNARFQLSRQFSISGLEFDRWTRKADGADLRRLVVRAEYRPIFPIRLRLRHAISSRDADRPDEVRNYTSWDSRFELIGNLSQYDQVRFLLSTSNLRFGGRGRLSGPPFPGDTQDDTTAKRGIPARALQGALTHQFTPHLAVVLSSEIYDGFLYNYEDNEFIVVDGKGFRSWFLLRSRVSDRLSWRLKWTSDDLLSRTYVDIRNFGNQVAPTPDAVRARGGRSSFRFQLDLSL